MFAYDWFWAFEWAMRNRTMETFHGVFHWEKLIGFSWLSLGFGFGYKVLHCHNFYWSKSIVPIPAQCLLKKAFLWAFARLGWYEGSITHSNISFHMKKCPTRVMGYSITAELNELIPRQCSPLIQMLPQNKFSHDDYFHYNWEWD